MQSRVKGAGAGTEAIPSTPAWRLQGQEDLGLGGDLSVRGPPGDSAPKSAPRTQHPAAAECPTLHQRLLWAARQGAWH